MNDIPMVYVKDQSLEDIGALEKALNVHPTIKVNKLSSASFSLPGNDPKNELCNHFNFIEIISRSGRNKGLYRIMPARTQKDSSTDMITYSCEHALATLMDDVMEGQRVFTDMTTEEVLQAILDLQSVKHWELGVVEVNNYLNYAFEDENSLLAPIFEVPKNFIDPYLFAYDTTVYPFKLHLLKASDEVVGEMRWGKDMGDFNKVADPTNIINYVIPKGEGEGVNKLTIEDVNNGKNYLKDQASIDKWGIKKRIEIDRRFIDKKSLKAFGQSILEKNKDPKISLTAKAYDLSIKEEYKGTERVLYGMTDLIVDDDVYQVRILEEDIPDLSKEWDVNYKLGNRLDNSASQSAETKRRLDVNDSYSVGATNILNADRVENADPQHPIRFKIRIPDDAIHVNYMELTWETEKFRGYTRGVKGGGAFVKSSEVQSKSTESGGAYVKESTIQSKSTEGGGAYVKNSEVKITDTHNIAGSVLTRAPVLPEGVYPGDTTHWHSIDPQWFAHSHTLTIPGINIAPHTHGFSITIPGISIPSHSHIFKVTIPEINIPEHTHPTEYGIYEHAELPSKLEIKVDGTIIPETGLSRNSVEITGYLEKDANGKIKRNRFAIVEIRPIDNLAQISANVIWGLFIRSHKGVLL